MRDILRLAALNLARYKRRTALTALLITLGVTAVLLFIAVAGSFKAMMVGQITDSMLGHLQIHRAGYVAAVENLPLNRNLNAQQLAQVEQVLAKDPAVASYSLRIKLGAMFSNFNETTNIRLNAVVPEKEAATMPLLTNRISEGNKAGLVGRGEILIPELLARGMRIKVGDTIVLVATNKEGSVNGQPFVVRGVLSGISGPGGRDGVVHLDDAKTLLRIEGVEVSEVAVRLRTLKDVPATTKRLAAALAATGPDGQPLFEVHSWEKLTPFATIARMIDLMTMFIRVMLIAIVLVSIMNVMIMAVYERINEIGTMAAIGTQPGSIMALFVTEGFLLGVLGIALGTVISLLAVIGLRAAHITFAFGMQSGIALMPVLTPKDIATVAVLVIIIAVVASLQPAAKAAKMDPITALRHV